MLRNAKCCSYSKVYKSMSCSCSADEHLLRCHGESSVNRKSSEKLRKMQLKIASK